MKVTLRKAVVGAVLAALAVLSCPEEAQARKHYVLAELREQVEAAKPRAFVSTTVTKSDDCGSSTTTTSKFVGGAGAGGGAGGGKCKGGDGKGAEMPVVMADEAPKAAAAAAAPAAPAAAAAAAAGEENADGEFDATRLSSPEQSAGCNGGGEECKDKKSVTSALKAVASVDQWMRDFRRKNRLDPRSVAEEIAQPFVNAMRRHNDVATRAIEADQEMQRAELTERISAHAYEQLRKEMRTPQKVVPRPADHRGLFGRIHDVMTGADVRKAKAEAEAVEHTRLQKAEQLTRELA